MLKTVHHNIVIRLFINRPLRQLVSSRKQATNSTDSSCKTANLSFSFPVDVLRSIDDKLATVSCQHENELWVVHESCTTIA